MLSKQQASTRPYTTKTEAVAVDSFSWDNLNDVEYEAAWRGRTRGFCRTYGIGSAKAGDEFHFLRINIALVSLDKYVRFVSCCSVLELFVQPKRTP